MQVPRTNRPAVKMGDAVAHLEGLGVNTEGIRGRASTRKRGRSLGPAGDDDGDDDGMDVDGEGGKRVRATVRVGLLRPCACGGIVGVCSWRWCLCGFVVCAVDLFRHSRRVFGVSFVCGCWLLHLYVCRAWR